MMTFPPARVANELGQKAGFWVLPLFAQPLAPSGVRAPRAAGVGIALWCLQTSMGTLPRHLLALWLWRSYLNSIWLSVFIGESFPGGASGKENACQCRRHNRCGCDPWVSKIPWRKSWELNTVFLTEESLHGPCDHTDSEATEVT